MAIASPQRIERTPGESSLDLGLALGVGRRKEAEDGCPIPDVVIRRLPIYVRALGDLIEKEVHSVSSDDLAELIGVTAAQIRRDLSYFGRFGKQGKGYDVQRLLDEVKRILKLDQQWDVALVGYGNLGRAIVQFGGYLPGTFRIAAIFDRHARQMDDGTGDLPILSDDEIADEVARKAIRIGIVAVPTEAAQAVADALVRGGVTAILNYAPCLLRAPSGVAIRDIDPIGAMQSMTYYLEP